MSEPTTIWVLTEEPYHDNSSVLGVFGARGGAIAAAESLARAEPQVNLEQMWLLSEFEIDTQKLLRTIAYFRYGTSWNESNPAKPWYEKLPWDGKGFLLRREEKAK